MLCIYSILPIPMGFAGSSSSTFMPDNRSGTGTPPVSLCPLSAFDPLVSEWFQSRFQNATEPQLQGWPEIAAGRNILISAPTGSGKTLAAFLICIDQLVRAARTGALADETQVVYISPLK